MSKLAGFFISVLAATVALGGVAEAMAPTSNPALNGKSKAAFKDACDKADGHYSEGTDTEINGNQRREYKTVNCNTSDGIEKCEYDAGSDVTKNCVTRQSVHPRPGLTVPPHLGEIEASSGRAESEPTGPRRIGAAESLVTTTRTR
jgi:hypothetical protein